MPFTQPPDSDTYWWFRYVTYGLFAGFAGVCGHLLRRIDSNEKIVWSRALIESAAAGFVGVLCLMACQALGMSEQWTGVIVGVSGWLGASATIKMLEQLIRKKLGLDPNAAAALPEPLHADVQPPSE